MEDDETLDQLLLHLKDKVKKAYIARRNEEGALLSNVANLGAEVGDECIVSRSGDYSGLSVEVLTPIHALLTDEVMRRALLALKKEAVVTALEILDVDSVESVYALIDAWFKVATFDYKSVYDGEGEVDESRLGDVHAPLQGRLRLLTVVATIPEEWAGRVFESGDELQKEWSNVRQGPPVTYAVMYTMTVVREKSVLSHEEVEATTFYFIDGAEWRMGSAVEENYQYVVYDEVAIGFRDLISSEQAKTQSLSVGRLVSQLQKCVRFGPRATSLLIDTATFLSLSPDYHVPERNFERVSAARQLAWRSYISILEDAGPLEGVEYLLLLTLVYSKVRGMMSKDVLYKVVELLMASLSVNSLEWRKKKDKTRDLDESHYSLALRFIPMMEGDRSMLGRYLEVEEVIPTTSEWDLVDDEGVSLSMYK